MPSDRVLFWLLVTALAAETAGYIIGGMRLSIACGFLTIAVYAMALAILAQVRE